MNPLKSVLASSYFNPRSREGSDLTVIAKKFGTTVFQSTLP